MEELPIIECNHASRARFVKKSPSGKYLATLFVCDDCLKKFHEESS